MASLRAASRLPPSLLHLHARQNERLLHQPAACQRAPHAAQAQQRGGDDEQAVSAHDLGGLVWCGCVCCRAHPLNELSQHQACAHQKGSTSHPDTPPAWHISPAARVNQVLSCHQHTCWCRAWCFVWGCDGLRSQRRATAERVRLVSWGVGAGRWRKVGVLLCDRRELFVSVASRLAVGVSQGRTNKAARTIKAARIGGAPPGCRCVSAGPSRRLMVGSFFCMCV